MKILLVDPWNFTPPYDAALCGGLEATGHDVTFVTASGGGHEADEGHGAKKRLALFKAPPPGLPRALALALKGLAHIGGMVRLLARARRERPDAIHFQWLPLPLIDGLLLPLFRRIAPVVLTVHDTNPYNGDGPWLLRAGTRGILERADRLIVHNAYSERVLEACGLPAARIDRVAHGLLMEEAPAAERQVEGRAEAAPVQFLQFGKIKDYKGADLLIEAVGLLSPVDRTRCRVRIVGRPYIDPLPLRARAAELGLDETLELRFDFVSDDEMTALFDGADFLVFPYRGIDTSGVLMAAIAKEIPVVASNLGCFGEMLQNGEGVLVPPEEPKALAEALAGLIRSPEKRRAMQAAMQALRADIPSWEQIAAATVAVYRKAGPLPASRPAEAHP
jgi:glycosyltransferase involved in cell wall biosynthesis